MKRDPIETITVRGRGIFPLDMLRYDCCFPATSEDVSLINETGELRSVTLVLRNAIRIPTVGRWNSFTWAVESATRKSMKEIAGFELNSVSFNG